MGSDLHEELKEFINQFEAKSCIYRNEQKSIIFTNSPNYEHSLELLFDYFLILA